MRDRSWTLLAGPLLAFASLTLLGVGAEVALRVQHARWLDEAREERRDPSGELCTEPDPVLVYRYVPGRCDWNERGYRDSPRSLRPAPGVLRLVVIGDSVAVGDGIALDERFDRVLVRRLAAAGVRAEAVNLARTGYSTSQELVVLEREGYAYQPDAVVWSYVLNDPAHPVFHNANGRLGRFHFRPRVHVWHGLRRLAFKLRERVAGLSCPAEYHELLHCTYADAVSAHIERIGALARAHGAPTIFLIHPLFETDRPFAEASLAGLHERLGWMAREAGLVVVDLLAVYRGHDPEALKQHPEGWYDPWHPGARGHALAAEALATALRRAGVSGDEGEAGDGGGEPERDGGAA